MLGDLIFDNYFLFSCLTEWIKGLDFLLLSQDYESIIMTLLSDFSHGCYETMQTIG